MRALALTSMVMTALLAACGGETVLEVDTEVEPFVGVWGALSFELLALAGDPPPRRELIRDGVTVTMEFREDGRFIITQTVPSRDEPGIDRGNIEVFPATGRVSLTFDGSRDAPLVGSFVFDDDPRILTLTLPEASFDFDGDGAPEPARSRLVLVKEEDR